MSQRLSPDQFHHPLEEIDHLEGYLANREYMNNQWYKDHPTPRNQSDFRHVVAAQKRDETMRRLEGLEAGLPTVGPYL